MAKFTHLHKWPVEMPPGWISGRFREWYGEGAGRYEHGGQDLATSLNAEVRLWAGDVEGDISYRDESWGNGSLGVCAIVNFKGTPYWMVFAHLTPGSYEDRTYPIRDGALLGWVGMTGLTNGAHVHIGMSSEDAPNFARMADTQGRITNPNLLDPEPFFKIGVPVVTNPAPAPKPAVTWEDVLEATYGTPERMLQLLNGGHVSLERRVANMETMGEQISLRILAEQRDVLNRHIKG